MTAKEAVLQRVREMSEDEAAELLDYLQMLADPDTLDAEEMAEVEEAEREFARGEYITREQVLERFAT